MAKTALVVDDSRVALLSLSRLLKAQGLLVDMAESGPEAINYLRLNPRPTAIFLDHMMPGMDGFETLAALKSSPATSGIPVVMYTAKADEAYLQEARTRGACDVLQKPLEPLALDRILAALQIFPDQDFPVAVARADVAAPATTRPATVTGSAVSVKATHPATDQSVVPPRMQADVAVPYGGRSRGWGVAVWAIVLVFVVGGAWWSLVQYGEVEQTGERLRGENTRLNVENARLLAVERRMAEEREAAAEAEALAEPAAVPALSPVLLDALAWALNRDSRYDYAEIPFSDARLQLLRELVTRLSEAGFHGTVRLEGHIGQFCLVRDDQGRSRLPLPGTPYAACEVVSYPPAEAIRLAQRQSDAFARYLADHALGRPPIEIAIVSHGTSRPLQRYPDALKLTAASEWNVIARNNQRVGITLIPAAR